MSGKSVYGCTVLAIDAQGKNIETIEGLPQSNPISNAFVNNDGQQFMAGIGRIGNGLKAVAGKEGGSDVADGH